jgi:hypothetical protein
LDILMESKTQNIITRYKQNQNHYKARTSSGRHRLKAYKANLTCVRRESHKSATWQKTFTHPKHEVILWTDMEFHPQQGGIFQPYLEDL